MSVIKVLNRMAAERESLELSAENVELKNIATLDKLYDESVKLIPELKKLQKWNSLWFKNNIELKKKFDKQSTKTKKADDKRREAEKKAETLYDEYKYEEKQLESVKNSMKGNDDLMKDIEKKSKDAKRNNQLRKELIKNIEAFEKAAKSLGFEPKTGKYQKILQQLQGLPVK
jgi:hypothetical protein